ncbi:MAG: hypothetical protein BAJATHORv1_30151 [Candidatus Thorarchaeota archaeon]|nr:MAG: hypothetical protein BAJATHORv1_30151 [Candidatus Thorarchaeota archaeon]
MKHRSSAPQSEQVAIYYLTIIRSGQCRIGLDFLKRIRRGYIVNTWIKSLKSETPSAALSRKLFWRETFCNMMSLLLEVVLLGFFVPLN